MSRAEVGNSYMTLAPLWVNMSRKSALIDNKIFGAPVSAFFFFVNFYSSQIDFCLNGFRPNCRGEFIASTKILSTHSKFPVTLRSTHVTSILRVARMSFARKVGHRCIIETKRTVERSINAYSCNVLRALRVGERRHYMRTAA